tara:strand:- start:257 stop:643 length:387 start_codon:yes stop_codon:yes gene_type:complete
MNECIICLEEIPNNHGVDLSCCKVKIHKICIYNWISLNLCKNKELNKDINKCIYCKQQSQQLNDIIETIKQNNTNIVIDTQQITPDTNTQNEIIMYNSNEKIKKFMIFVFFTTCTIGLSITLILFLIT